MFTLDDYFKGRDIDYADEFDPKFNDDAMDLLGRVSALLAELGIYGARITSGWRPKAINTKAGGAPHSWHRVARAVDLADPDGSLALAILEEPHLLTDHGLWLEDPKFTKGWVHLDTGKRPARKPQIFKPR